MSRNTELFGHTLLGILVAILVLQLVPCLPALLGPGRESGSTMRTGPYLHAPVSVSGLRAEAVAYARTDAAPETWTVVRDPRGEALMRLEGCVPAEWSEQADVLLLKRTAPRKGYVLLNASRAGTTAAGEECMVSLGEDVSDAHFSEDGLGIVLEERSGITHRLTLGEALGRRPRQLVASIPLE